MALSPDRSAAAPPGPPAARPRTSVPEKPGPGRSGTSRFGRGFWRLWTATAASGLGDGTRIAALAVYAAVLTEDPLQVALVGVAGKLPWTLVGPFAGVLVDRLDRWRTLWICDVARALVMGTLVLLIVTGQVGIGALALVSFLLTSIATLADNLSQAVVGDVVGTGSLESANSRLIGGQLIASEFLGAPLGTALFVAGRPLPFALDTVTFALSALLVCSVRMPRARPAEAPATPMSARTVLAETAEGVRWLWRHRLLRTVCVLTALMNFCVVAVMSIAVLFALHTLDISEREYGLLLGVLAVGGLAGLLLAPVAVRSLGRGRTLRLSFALCPVPFFVAGTTSHAILAAATLTCVGVSVSLTTVVTTSLRQELVPARLFGRVNGGYRLVVNGLSPVGGLVGGGLAGAFGLRAPFFLAAALTAAATGAALLLPRAALDAEAAPARRTPHQVPRKQPTMTDLRTPPVPGPDSEQATGPARPPAVPGASRRLRLLTRALVPVLAALAAAGTVLGAVDTPDPLPRTASAEAFSADRAHDHIAAIARRPHHLGTAEHDRVRDELIGRFEELGLDARIERGTGAETGEGAALVGWTQNITATLPGTDSTGSLLVVAHYDSAETSPGASDDGLGVGAALEVARALTSGPALRNDVTFLITDGEEPGLLGARAHVAAQRTEAGPTVVLNLEARGTSGRAVMFETGPGNGPLVRALADHPPVATSLSDEVYRLLPNDTDFTALRESGASGLNFAVIGGSARYHTPQDSLDHLDRGGLQDLGAATLAATRSLGAADLAATAEAGDATYFNLGGLLVSYPDSWVLFVALLAVAALALALRGARGAVGLRGVALTAATLPLALAAAAVAGTALWPVLTWIKPELTGFLLGTPYRPGPFVLAAVLLAATATWTWAVRLRRRVTGLEASAGVTLWLALCGLLTALLLPGASYLFVWPALAGAAGLAVAVRLADGSPWRAPLLSAALVPAAALLGPVTVLLFDAVPLALAAAPLLLVVLCLAAALPLVTGALRRTAARAFTALGTVGALLAVLAGLLVAGPDRAHPAQVSLVYTLDADTGRARWASTGAGHSDWLGHYLDESGTRPVSDTFPALDEPANWRTGPAPSKNVALPEVQVLATSRDGDTRHIRLRLSSRQGRAAELALYADAGSTRVVAAKVAAHHVPGGANRAYTDGPWTWGLLLAGPPADGVEVELEVRGDTPLRLRAVAWTPGLPAGSLDVPRPADVTWSGRDSGVTLASRGYTV
ncbi:MFS transporter [Streptomyces sp. NPDC051963]|uniref:MFS transporter n=1 Tax=Streptomyces sp. NPDC051963 TaxID=3365678 RepID=UPI0037D76615